MIEIKYLLSFLSIRHYVSQNGWQHLTEVWTFWYLAFKKQKKKFFVKIDVFGEVVLFSHIGENTKENIINFWYWFIFALISLLFISRNPAKAKIIVKIWEIFLPNSDKNNFIDFPVKFNFIDFIQNITIILQ